MFSNWFSTCKNSETTRGHILMNTIYTVQVHGISCMGEIEKDLNNSLDHCSLETSWKNERKAKKWSNRKLTHKPVLLMTITIDVSIFHLLLFARWIFKNWFRFFPVIRIYQTNVHRIAFFTNKWEKCCPKCSQEKSICSDFSLFFIVFTTSTDHNRYHIGTSYVWAFRCLICNRIQTPNILFVVKTHSQG